MVIEVLNPALESLFDFLWRSVVGVSQGGAPQDGKPWLDQVEPGALGRQPVELNSAFPPLGPMGDWGRLVGTQVVQDQVDAPLAPSPQHHLVKKVPAVFTVLCGRASPRPLAGVRAESAEELERAVLAAVAIRATSRLFRPTPAPARDGLERSRLVKANHRAVARRVTVEPDDGVFFASKSGSELSHHVCPVRKLSPC